MADLDELYSAVCAHPYEDTPRLVYADCLEEQGQPKHANYIRAQVELTKHPEGSCFAGAEASEEGQGLSANQIAIHPLPARMNRYPFRRGFLEGIGITAEDFLAPGQMEELQRCFPITKVNIRGITPGNAEAIAARLNALQIHGLGITDLMHYRGEYEAQLTENQINLIFQRLLANDQSRHLQVLDLSGNRLAGFDTCLQRFADACRFLGNLRELDLSDNMSGLPFDRPSVIAHLPEATRHLGKLKSLKLQMNHIGAANASITAGSDITRLAEAMTPLTQLEHLDLACNLIGASGRNLQGFRDVTKSLSTLKSLNLALNRIGDVPSAVSHLSVALKSCPELRGLDLSGNKGLFANKRARSHVSAIFKNTKQLRVLGMNDVDIPNDRAAAALGEAMKPLGELEVLKLVHNENALGVLGGAKYWPKLKQANLGSTGIGNYANDTQRFADALVQWNELRVLNLQQNSIDSHIEPLIAAINQLPLLQLVDAGNGRLTAPYIAEELTRGCPRGQQPDSIGFTVLDGVGTQQAIIRQLNAAAHGVSGSHEDAEGPKNKWRKFVGDDEFSPPRDPLTKHGPKRY